MSALEQALIVRFGTLGRVPTPFLLRSDNGLVFTSRAYSRLVRSYGLRQQFITPHCPQQSGMIERVIRTLKEQCVHRHRFETQQHASRVIGEWIRFYNTRRPHQALGMKTPAYGVCFSGLACAENGGSLQPPRSALGRDGIATASPSWADAMVVPRISEQPANNREYSVAWQ